jgi:hypothetical protein
MGASCSVQPMKWVEFPGIRVAKPFVRPKQKLKNEGDGLILYSSQCPGLQVVDSLATSRGSLVLLANVLMCLVLDAFAVSQQSIGNEPSNG